MKTCILALLCVCFSVGAYEPIILKAARVTQQTTQISPDIDGNDQISASWFYAEDYPGPWVAMSTVIRPDPRLPGPKRIITIYLYEVVLGQIVPLPSVRIDDYTPSGSRRIFATTNVISASQVPPWSGSWKTYAIGTKKTKSGPQRTVTSSTVAHFISTDDESISGLWKIKFPYATYNPGTQFKLVTYPPPQAKIWFDPSISALRKGSGKSVDLFRPNPSASTEVIRLQGIGAHAK